MAHYFYLENILELLKNLITWKESLVPLDKTVPIVTLLLNPVLFSSKQL